MKGAGRRKGVGRTLALGVGRHPDLAPSLADHAHADRLVPEAFGLLLGLAKDHAVLELLQLGRRVALLLGPRALAAAALLLGLVRPRERLGHLEGRGLRELLEVRVELGPELDAVRACRTRASSDRLKEVEKEEEGGDGPSREARSRSMRAARTHLAPTVR